MLLRATKFWLVPLTALGLGACEVTYLDECRVETGTAALVFGRAVGGGAAGFQDGYIQLEPLGGDGEAARSGRVAFSFSEAGEAWFDDEAGALFLYLADEPQTRQRASVRFGDRTVAVSEVSQPAPRDRLIGMTWQLGPDGFVCGPARDL